MSNAYLTVMRWLFLTLVVGLFASGCSTASVRTLLPGEQPTRSPEVTLHMDTDFTAEERSDADLAVDVWSKQTDGLAKIHLVYDLDFNSLSAMQRLADENLVIRADSTLAIVARADEESDCDGCVLGWMTSGGIHSPTKSEIHGAFVMDRITGPGIRLQVMIHEFGHVLGLSHVGQRQSLMYPSVIPGRTECLKKSDLVEFCAVNECGTHTMYPCE